MKKLIALCLVSGLLFACKDAGLKKELKRLSQLEINIPDIQQCMYAGQDTTMNIVNDAYAKMVIFYDSTVCSSCQMSRIWEWEDVVGLSKATNGKFSPVFVFNPPKGKINELKIALKTYPFKYPVFLDEDGEFIKHNPELPANTLLHTFLVDKNNKVVLVGKPVGNEQLWELYKSTIRDLVNNNGILPDSK